MRLVLLGANGFLGNEIQSFINQNNDKDYQILKISKDSFIENKWNMKTILNDFKPDRVINAISPRLNLNPIQTEVKFSCLDAPKLIFDTIKSLEQKCTWIDCGTYWSVCGNKLNPVEEYYVEMKKKFKSYSTYNENNKLKYKNVVLNHIFGRHENKQRLLPTVIKKLRRNESIHLYNPENLMPLNSVKKITKILFQYDFNDENNNYFIAPDWSGSVLELVNTLKQQLESLSVIKYDYKNVNSFKINKIKYDGIKLEVQGITYFEEIASEYN
jgi:hypothetical protein